MIFYSLPEYPHFYPELVNMLSANHQIQSEADATSMITEELQSASGEESLSCLVLSSKYEKLALERVIGGKRADHMLKSDKSTFVFF
jgi:hypothetical protein